MLIKKELPRISERYSIEDTKNFALCLTMRFAT